MIAPSILTADFARLADEVAAVDNADWLHVDVMDNHFVPNLTIGPVVVDSLLQVAKIPMDCHLMITDPGRWAPGYAEAGAHNVTFHAEATDDPTAVARDIRAAGARAGLAIKPNPELEPYLEVLRDFDTLLIMSVEPGFGGQKFIPEVLSKVVTARKLVDAGELNILVATKLAMQRAARGAPVTLFLVDAVNGVGLEGEERALVRGDQISYAIAAASILAKVARDKAMEALDLAYPHYGFARHKGYGTALHLQALREFGPCPAHRPGFLRRILP